MIRRSQGRQTPARRRTEGDTTAHLDAVMRIARAIQTATSRDQMQSIAEEICRAFNVDACVIRHLEADGLTLIASAGLPEQHRHLRIPAHYGLSKLLVENRRPVLIPDCASHPMLAPRIGDSPISFRFVSYAGTPLITHDRVLGVLGLFTTRERRTFTAADLAALEAVSGYAAVILERLFPFQQPAPENAGDGISEATADYRYRSLVELTSDWVWETNRECRYTFLSPQVERTLGYRPEEVFGKTPYDLMGPDAPSVFKQDCETILTEQRRFAGLLLPQVDKTGQIVWIEKSGMPLFNSQGEWIGYRGVGRDVTERIRREEELRQSQRFIEKIAQTSPDVLYIFDEQEKRNIYVNREIFSLLGYTPEEMQAMGAELIPRLAHPEDIVGKEPYLHLRNGLGDGEFSESEYRMRHKDGSWRWLRSRETIFERDTTDNSVRRVFGVAQDITAQKAAEAVLTAEAQKQEQIAETLQRSLLVRTALDAFPGLEIETFYEAASDETLIGGDFFDGFITGQGLIALVVGDIMGKGLRAAIDIADVKFTLRAFLRESPCPADALARMNAHLRKRQTWDSVAGESLVAATIAVVNTSTGAVEVAVAGMEPPLIRRGATGIVETVETDGTPLGAIARWEPDGERFIHLATGDLLVLYTDGLSEARANDSLDLLGREGVSTALTAVGNCDLKSAGEMLLECSRTFAGGGLPDDVCLLLARYR